MRGRGEYEKRGGTRREERGSKRRYGAGGVLGGSFAVSCRLSQVGKEWGEMEKKASSSIDSAEEKWRNTRKYFS